jgi:gamma-glutamyltranspeptidase/glutathione hydrolase
LTSNAVVTPHRLSAQAARSVLIDGGNAVDAAVAAVAAQGVVAPETCGLGGDLFALVHAPGWDRPRALNASGRAGSNVSAKELRSAGLDEIPGDDPAVVTVPGCVDGLTTLIDELGRGNLADALAPAIDYASSGFEVSREQARAFARRAHVYATKPAVGSFYPGGQPVAAAAVVKRPDLARTLSDIATEGRSAFYEGTPGADIMDAVGGLITVDDLSRGHTDWIDPIGLDVFGLHCWTIPPNSQGYLGPATLAVFEMLDPPEDMDDPLWWHLLIEAYRCLAWERNDIVSDPETAALPANLVLERSRLERAASTVDRARAGIWPERLGRLSGTAYMCVVDDEGMTVSIIQSNYRGLGSPFTAARSGFILQDRGLGFTLASGHPNELGPGKRPLHTLSPTLWTLGDQPRWTLGTRGGGVQPQLVAQLGARAIRGGMGLEEAQEAPRWTVADFGPSSGPSAHVEPATPGAIRSGLEQRGHELVIMEEPQPGWGPMSLIEIAAETRRAAADPRVDTATALVF